MTADRDVTRIVRTWLEAGTTTLPDRVLDEVLDRLPATPQRRPPWPTWRLTNMPAPIRAAIAAAAIGLFSVLGISVMPPPTTPVGPYAEASPTPSIAPGSPVPLPGGPLEPGRYTTRLFVGPTTELCMAPPQPDCVNPTEDDTVRVSYTIPDGWSAIERTLWLTDGHNSPPGGAGLDFGRGPWLHSQPCLTDEQIALDNAPADIEVGPGVDDFATALAEHPLLDTTSPVDVTLDGYSGKYLDLQVPLDLSDCAQYYVWEPGIYAQGPGHRWHIWILDVDGVRVVMTAYDYAETTPERRAQLASIVDSIDLEREPDPTAPPATSTASGAP